MDANTTEHNYLVLVDQTGNYYAIPANELESYKVKPEHKAEIDAALGDDVQGFGYMMDEMLAGTIVADKRRAAAQNHPARQAKSQNTEAGSDEESATGKPAMIMGFITGRFMSLAHLKRA